MIALLGFLRSPVTKYVGLVLAVIVAIAWIREDAASQARDVAQAECQNTFTQRVDAEVSRQVDVVEEVLRAARIRAVETAVEMAELQERADELLAELANVGKTDSCPLDADTVRRLRDIR